MMQPFNGTNSHSVLIMGNCSIHHVSEVRELLRTASIVSVFLPPYSPDLNPAFSKVKMFLRKHDG